jgi:RNA polymerase sigma-32 factor
MHTQIPSFMKSHQKLLSQEEESQLINEFLETKNPILFDKIIRAYSPIVIKYAKKYSSYGIASDELISVGNHALVEVVYRFDPKLGYRFATYCSGWIRGMMLGFIAANYLSVSIKNQKIKKVFFTLRSLLYNDFKKNGNDDITTEMLNQLQGHFDVPKEDIEQIYHAIKQPMTSLNDPVSTGDENEVLTRGDQIESDDPNPEDILLAKKMDTYRHKIIHTAIQESLNQKEKFIILRQMPTDDDFITLQELADELNISRERVRQIRKKAMEKLEKWVNTRISTTQRKSLYT